MRTKIPRREASEAALAGLSSPPARYGVAVLAILVAVAIKLLLESIVGDTSAFLLLAVAVLAAAVFGGFGPGALASVLGAVLGDYLFLKPAGTIGFSDPQHTVLAGLFLVQGLAISAIAASVTSARRRSDAALADAKKAEATLRQSRQESRRRAGLLENSHDAIFSWKLGGAIDYWNSGAERLYGWSREEAVGRISHDLLKTEHPIPVKELEDHLRTARDWEGELVHHTRDGRRVVVESRHVLARLDDGEYVLETNRDVTARKQAEETLVASEARSRAVLGALTEGVVFLDTEGVVQSANEAVKHVLGRTLEELADPELDPRWRLLREDGTLFPVEEQPAIVALQTGRAVRNVEMGVPRPDGTLSWISVNAQPVRDTEGNLLGAVASFFDITERKQFEEELKAGEERFRATFEQAAVGTAHVGLDGRWIRVNKKLCEIVGYPPEELLAGLTFQDITHPEDLEADLEQVGRLMSGEIDTYSMEKRYYRKDGSVVWINLTGSLVRGPAGEPQYFIAIIEDINSRKETEISLRRSEERYRTLFESIDEGFCVIESLFDENDHPVDYRFLEVNPAFEAQTGLVDAVGRTIRELVPDIEPRWAEIYGRVALTGEPVRTEDNAAAMGRWFDVYAFRIGDPADRRVAVLFKDVTERKQAELALRRFNETLEQRVAERTTQLEAANGELEAFSYSVSHDLRAPLRHISGFAEMLEKSAGASLDETGRRYLGIILDSTARAGELIDDLLSFSQVGRAEMRHHTVNTDKLARKIVDALAFEVDGREVEWKIEDLPRVWGDEPMLRLVFENLLSNAVKYTGPRKKAVIEVGGRKDGDEVVFFVRDNGVGFDEKYADKLFGVFQRLHHQEEFKGTGIGLANVRRIIDRHGGRVWAKGRPGEGATFFFSVPDNTEERNAAGG